jgi:hypothetical protein
MPDQDEHLHIKGYRVSPELFSTGYKAGVGPYVCNSKCCWRGAYVDVAERDRVLAHAAMIKPHMDETQSLDESTWFETEEKVDADYKSGTCVGTGTVNGKCAMMDKQGHCSLQVAGTATGQHKWVIKPLYCFLFPIEVINNTIQFDSREQNNHACCSVQTHFDVPLFQACHDELVYLLGEDGYALLQAHYDTTSARTKVLTADNVKRMRLQLAT